MEKKKVTSTFILKNKASKKYFLKSYGTHVNSIFIPTSYSSANISDNHPSDTINAVPKGNGSFQRTGNKIVIKQILCKILLELEYFSLFNTYSKPGTTVKFCLVLDRSTNGTKLKPQDVFDDQYADAILGYRRNRTTSKYTILRSWVVNLEHPSSTSTKTQFSDVIGYNGKNEYRECVINCNIPVTFKGDNENITSISDYSISMVAVATLQQSVRISYETRVKYLDF